MGVELLMFLPSSLGILSINGREVGIVTRVGSSTSWSYGNFHPSPSFEEFAPLFQRWSQLMHCGDLSKEISESGAE